MASTDSTNNGKPKQVKTNNLQDLSALMEELKSEENAPSKVQGNNYSIYRNSTNNIVSLMAYLIGVDKEYFDDKNGFSAEIYEKNENLKETRIFRNLCRVRNSFERYYIQIVNAFRNEIKNIGTVPEFIPSDAIDSLTRDGIKLYKSKPEIDQYIIAINQEISNRVNSLSKCFPEWINWNYIKPIFLMPDGTKVEGIKKAGEYYNSDRNRYPFRCWINWEAVSVGDSAKGNILYNDEKFCTMLYERHEDIFENLSFVRDVSDATKNNFTELLERSKKCVIVVDCENSNAVKLAAAISSLSKEQVSKINKILLFDSLYTTTEWNTWVDRNFKAATTKDDFLPLEHIPVDRLNQSKSLVDMFLAVRTTKEVATNGVDAVILASSDSDYWAMIQQLEGTKFLVMLERIKTGQAIIDTLSKHDIPFCFIDDFCINASYNIKINALVEGIQERIDKVLNGEMQEPINLLTFMNETIQDSWITMTEKEKTGFYNRYLQHMKLTIDSDGSLKLKINKE